MNESQSPNEPLAPLPGPEESPAGGSPPVAAVASGRRRAGAADAEAPLRTGPPSWGKMLLIILSSLLLVPLGIGTGTMFGDCEGMADDSFAQVNGESIDRAQLVYQLVREQGFNSGDKRSAAELVADERRVLDRILAVHVLAHQAREQGLEVSEADLAGFLRDPRRNGDFPLLQGPDGQLDLKHYQLVVERGFHLGLKRYEDYKRLELLALRALERMGPGARGPEISPGMTAVEAWLFHPFVAARLGAQAPGPGQQVWALVEQARTTGKLKINEAAFRVSPAK